MEIDVSFLYNGIFNITLNSLYGVGGLVLYEIVRVLKKGYRRGIYELGYLYYGIIIGLLILTLIISELSGDVHPFLGVWIGVSVPSTLGILFSPRAKVEEDDGESEYVRIDNISLSLEGPSSNKILDALSKYFLNVYY